ncbi:MAG: nicotinamidase [Candidatus Dormibacteria bacterium]
MSTALICVEVQRDFLPGGSLAVPQGDAVVAPLVAAAQRADLVVATRDWHPAGHASFTAAGGSWPDHCVIGTPGAELHPAIAALADRVVDKGSDPARDAHSGFDGTGLAGWLRAQGVDRVVVGGLATVLDARAVGFSVEVLSDAIRAVELEAGDGERALAGMRAAGATLSPAGVSTGG